MKIIAHRGLITGPDDEKQNHPSQVEDALAEGYDAEIDVWHERGSWFLGHDFPTHRISLEWLTKAGLWIHCKNTSAFYNLQRLVSPTNHFFHDSDLIVLTSQGNIWTYFGLPETRDPMAICVMPEVNYSWKEIEIMVRKKQWAGFCTDHPRKIREWVE